MQMSQDNNRYILAWFLGTGFFAFIIILIFFDIQEGSKQIVNILLGSFGTAFLNAVNYFFGSSEGSKDKTRLLGDR